MSEDEGLSDNQTTPPVAKENRDGRPTGESSQQTPLHKKQDREKEGTLQEETDNFDSELSEHGIIHLREQVDELATPISSGGKKHKRKVTDSNRKQEVITTPTKNRFDILDTESELQSAFQNLQEPLSLATIPEEHEQYFSDGTGTSSKSKMGIPRTHTEPNSEEEDEGSHNQTKKVDTATPSKQYSSEPKGNNAPQSV